MTVRRHRAAHEPHLKSLHAALRLTTEHLAHELAGVGVAPQWSPTEWRVAHAAVSIHGVSGLLAQRRPWPGTQAWTEFLQEQQRQIRGHVAHIVALLQRIDQGARERGLTLVALKGAALHREGIYQPGERPMADVDLLAPAQDLPRVAQLLAELDYRPGWVTWKHRVFEPCATAGEVGRLGESSLNPIKIEVHSELREILPLRGVDLSQLAFASAAGPGLNSYPSHGVLLLHVLLHASGAMINRALRLIHLSDIARLTQRMADADWQELFRLGAQTADPTLWWAFPPLKLTARYFGCVPAAVLEHMARGCSWTLRRTYRERALSDVSLSYLWVSAFPGIEWSHSLREMGAYVAARLFPSAQTLALRTACAEALPFVHGGEWAYTSQRRRIVHWLLARQPRQETLQPLRAALSSL